MISINFSGDTVEEVAGQALSFVMRFAPPAVAAPDDAPPPADLLYDPLPAADATPSAVPPAEAPKRTRRTKAEMEAARAAEAAPANPTPAATLPAESSPSGSTAVVSGAATAGPPEPVAPLTFEDLKTALRNVCEKDGCGVEGAKALMASFGVARLSALAEEQWPAFLDAAKAKTMGGAK